MKGFTKNIWSQRGQALVELSLTVPILLVLTLGAIEISNIINARLVLSHLTREGANMISFGTPADLPGANNDALDAIIDGACPIISDGPPCSTGVGNPGQWEIIYSKIVENPAIPCPPTPCDYVIDLQVTRGNLNEPSKIGAEGATANLPLSSLDAGRTFYVVEVFYLYSPITPVANFGVNIGSTTFYEQAIF